MPFTSKPILPVLPKPDHLVGTCQARTLSDIEDKELRKKLRNRQSALAARERKKARMLELERKVAELQQTNKNMEDENRNLRCMLSSFLRASGCKNEMEVISNLAKGNCDISINVNNKHPTQKPKRMPPLIADFKPKVNDAPEDIQKVATQHVKLVQSTTTLYNTTPVPDGNMQGNYINYKPVKSEMQYYAPNVQHIDMRNAVAKENSIVVKQEMREENFDSNCQVKYANATSQIVSPSGTKPEENSIFAQALKCKARAMVLSNSTDNHVTLQDLSRKRQALPSIDAVFNSPSKKSTQEGNFTSNFANLPTTEQRSIKQFQPQELIAMDSSLRSTQSWTPSKDPVLSRSDFSSTNTTQTTSILCNELPLELSDIICEYHNSSNETKDELSPLYDNFAYSPLEKSSSNSPDSGLGLDDDIDWMPSVFDFS